MRLFTVSRMTSATAISLISPAAAIAHETAAVHAHPHSDNLVIVAAAAMLSLALWGIGRVIHHRGDEP